MMNLSRRTFVKMGIATAAAGLPAASPVAQVAPPAMLWGALLHMGTNMWSDIPVTSWGSFKGSS